MSILSFIVSCEWLSSQLTNSKIVIIDCRFRLGQPDWGYQAYQSSHIPGAYYLNLDQDLSSPVATHGGRHPFPHLPSLAEKLGAMGIILGETLVVAYDDLRFAFAARLWWLLRYLGHDKVALLDGGWHSWQKQGYPLSDQLSQPRSGNFEPSPHADWIIDIEGVKSRKFLPSVILIDSRDRDRYRGEHEPIDPIAGHIEGAVNSPWKEVTNDQGYLLPLVDQKRLWQDYQQAEEIIVYCGSGVTACVNLFSLALVGIPNTKLYPGGWSDWCSYLV